MNSDNQASKNTETKKKEELKRFEINEEKL